MNYSISIIIVSFNTRQITKECLESVFLNLKDLSAEVIVIDNDSQDGSVEMVREDFPQVQLIANKENVGFAAANNQGFEIATGDYILLLNSDTVVLGDVIQKSLEYMKKHNDVGAFGCRVLNTDRTLQRTCSEFPTLLNQLLQTLALDKLPFPKFLGKYQMKHWNRDTEREVEVISGCYLLIPKAVLSDVGPLDENFFFFGEETDWCLRIRKSGWKTMFSPVGEIIHHGSVSARKLNEKRDILLGTSKVKLHLKHNGYWAAVIVFFILLAFNFSRAVFWTVLALMKKEAATRATHFQKVTKENFSYWPGKL